MAHTYDVIVVGSGVAGLSSAYRLGADHNVLVVERDAIGGGTSSRASGAITTPVDYPDLPEWSDHALSFFRDLDGRGVFSFEERPYVRAVRPADEAEARSEAERAGVEFLDTGEAEARFPDVFTDLEPYVGVVVYEETGVLEVDELLATLRHEAAERGVEFRPDTAVESVRVDDGEVGGVETEFGTVEADHVVCAAGSGTRPLLEDVLELPLRRFTWNVAFLDPGRELGEAFPIGGDRERAFYWRATDDDHLLVGGENFFAAPDEEPGIDEAFRQKVEITIPEVLAPVADAEPIRWEFCRLADATTPDTRSIIDAPADAPDGVVIAAGFHGTGVMSTGSIGTAVRSLVTGEDAPFPLAPFALDRFETRTPDFEYASLFGG